MSLMREYGIDTVNFYYQLTREQSYDVLRRLKAQPGYIPLKEDVLHDEYSFTSAWLTDRGIRLQIRKRHNTPWYLSLILHPATLLGDDRPSALFHCTKQRYEVFTRVADKLLEPLELPCKVSEMTVTRVDVTTDIHFAYQESVDAYLRILKRSRILPHFKPDGFRPDDKKVEDCGLANSRLHKQTCKSASVFIYDKAEQLKSLKSRQGKTDGHILRFECQLRRRALEKRLKKSGLSSQQLLEEASDKAMKIIAWYVKRLQPKGTVVHYYKAQQIIDAVRSEKTWEQMQYLLRKVSDSQSLTAALKKLKACYGLSDAQVNRLLDQFASLGISPITLEDKSKFLILPEAVNMLK